MLRRTIQIERKIKLLSSFFHREGNANIKTFVRIFSGIVCRIFNAISGTVKLNCDEDFAVLTKTKMKA